MSSVPVIRQRQRPQPVVQTADPVIADPIVPVAQPVPPVGSDPDRAYAVGYGKPPVATRFGGSRGNRSGRKKGSRSHSTIIEEEFNAKIDVPGAGKLSKFQVSVRQLVNQAAKGDLKAIASVLRLGLEQEREARARSHADEQQASPAAFDQQDMGVLDLLLGIARDAAALPTADASAQMGDLL